MTPRPIRHGILLYLQAIFLFPGVYRVHADDVENQAQTQAPSVAFYYAANLPPELAVYDVVVVQPDNFSGQDLRTHPFGARLYAYTTVGEVEADRSYAADMPKSWLVGENRNWQSAVINQAEADWPGFFVSRVIAPLWEQGFRGFFLDTLDSYQLIAKTPVELARQKQGMVRVIEAIKHAYPDAKLIFNRGFEILPQVHTLAYAVVAESLFQGWDNGKHHYVDVGEEDRNWLLEQLNRVREEYGLPVIVIDYAPAHERERMRELAKRIRALGFTPWVTTPAIDAVGIGAHEIVPRRVLMLYDPLDEDGVMLAPPNRFLSMPLNYLGLIPELHDVGGGLPSTPLNGRYVGVVLWFAEGNDIHAKALSGWLKQQRAAGVPIVVMNYPGIPAQGGELNVLDLAPVPLDNTEPTFSVATQAPTVGTEIEPLLAATGQSFVKTTKPADVWLRLRAADDLVIEPVAITDWGGFALAPHAIAQLPALHLYRWVVDPFAFFKAALRLKDMPAPDVTTENGHRLLITHIDGDGFANLAEFPGGRYASEVLRDDVLKRYRIPTTVSVIQGEIAANGVYSKLSPKLEPVARSIFKLPHVEIASHTYSHPFDWGALERGAKTSANYAKGLNLPIAGYRFNEEIEIDGSIRYINEKLAPPGKTARVMLWSGNCDPGAVAVARTYAAGVGNMNGGDTFITESLNTLTSVGPIGVAKGNYFQVFAPNQNENVYTNGWTGPYYGFERVIETFKLTDTPRRLKPINIYYHTYSASKPAALQALHKVYRYALTQDILPVYASEYIRKAQNFSSIVLTREGAGWGIHGATDLVTMRLPATLGYPDMHRSQEILGYTDRDTDRYIHLSDVGHALLALSVSPPHTPHVVRAQGFVRHWSRSNDGSLSFEIFAHVRGDLELANIAECDVRTDNDQHLTRKHGRTILALPGNDIVSRVQVRCARERLAKRAE